MNFTRKRMNVDWVDVFGALDGLAAMLVTRRRIGVPQRYDAEHLCLKLGFATGILVGVLAAFIEHYRHVDAGSAPLANTRACE